MNMRQDDNSEVQRLLSALWRGRFIMLLCVVVAAAAAFGVARLQSKKYTASTAILFNGSQLSQVAAGLTPTPNANPQQSTATDFTLLTTQGNVAGRVARDLGHGLTAGAVTAAVQVAPKGLSTIADVTATSTDPLLAADIANDFAKQFIAVRQAANSASTDGILKVLQRQYQSLPISQRSGAQGQAITQRIQSVQTLGSLQSGDAQIVHQATVPGSPSSPQTRRDTVLGGIVGLVVALVLLVLREQFDRRLRSVAELKALTDIPLLGTIPHIDGVLTARTKVAAWPTAGARDADWDDLEQNQYPEPESEPGRVNSAIAMEAFRMLRAHLQYFNIDRELRTIILASNSPAEGKTLVSCYLAQAAASMGTRTLLIDADLRRSGVAQRLALPARLGLADVLVGNASLDAAIHPVSVESSVDDSYTEASLDVLVAGPPPPNAGELLESSTMVSLLEEVSRRYDLVVIDSTPLSVVSDAVPLMQRVDGVIAVARIGRTTRDGMRHLLERLENLNAPVLGTVANDETKAAEGYGYGYGYGEYFDRRPSSTNGVAPRR